MQTCQDQKKRDKMTEQTDHSGGSVALRLPFAASLIRAVVLQPPTRYFTVALYVFPKYLLGDGTLPFLQKKVFTEMLKIRQNPFLFQVTYSLLKVTRVVICIHSAINKYKLSQQPEKEL